MQKYIFLFVVPYLYKYDRHQIELNISNFIKQNTANF